MEQRNRGIALTKQAADTAAANAIDLLEEAITAYKKALEVYTQREFPRQWATTQKNLRDAAEVRCVRFKVCSD